MSGRRNDDLRQGPRAPEERERSPEDNPEEGPQIAPADVEDVEMESQAANLGLGAAGHAAGNIPARHAQAEAPPQRHDCPTLIGLLNKEPLNAVPDLPFPKPGEKDYHLKTQLAKVPLNHPRLEQLPINFPSLARADPMESEVSSSQSSISGSPQILKRLRLGHSSLPYEQVIPHDFQSNPTQERTQNPSTSSQSSGTPREEFPQPSQSSQFSVPHLRTRSATEESGSSTEPESTTEDEPGSSSVNRPRQGSSSQGSRSRKSSKDLGKRTREK